MPNGESELNQMANALVMASYNDSTTVAGGSFTQGTYTGNANAWQQQQLGCVQFWPYDYWHPWPTQIVYQTAPAPTWCAGHVHVFACEHAEECRCGKTKRVVKPTCAACGK